MKRTLPFLLLLLLSPLTEAWELGVNGGASYLLANKTAATTGAKIHGNVSYLAGLHVLTRWRNFDTRIFVEYQNLKLDSSSSIAGSSFSSSQQIPLVSAVTFLTFGQRLYFQVGGGAARRLTWAGGYFALGGGGFGVSLSKSLFIDLRVLLDLTTAISSSSSTKPLLAAAQLGWTLF